MNVIDFLDRGAERFPSRILVSDGLLSTTYDEFASLTRKIAARLTAIGLKESSVVVTAGPNHPDIFAAQFGIIRAGYIWTPLNVRNSISEHIAVLRRLGASWVFFHSSFENYIAEIRLSCPAISGFVCVDRHSPFGDHLTEFVAEYDGTHTEVVRGPDDVYAVLPTSGTTGSPKGVMLTNRAFETVVANFHSTMPFREPPVHLVVAPMSHAAGLFACSMLDRGATNILLSAPTPDKICEAIQQFKITVLFLPPTLIYSLLDYSARTTWDFSSLQYLLYGSAPMSRARLLEAGKMFGNVLFQVYGQVEALMNVTCFTPAEHHAAMSDPLLDRRLASCGRPSPFGRVALMDDGGSLLPPGAVGEVVCRGNHVTPGYFDDPAATAEISQYGWHHTGDLGYLDEDGYLYLVDRKKDMIVSGGFNVYPSEVEQVIWSHSAVQDCAVIGIPDEKWGEAVAAVIQLNNGETLEAEDVIQLCKASLGGVKAPKHVFFWPELPRSSNGKVLKRKIRESYWKGRSRRIN